MIKALYVDAELLDKKMSESGLKTGFICEQLGISRQGFAKKVKGITPFRASEVYVLCSLLLINSDERLKIFYPKEQPNVDRG